MKPLANYEHLNPPLVGLYRDKVHYACGKNVIEDWFNVDGFDESYPYGQVELKDAQKIFRLDLTAKHPFKANFFRIGFAEDFLEHLDQAESVIFLSECYRTFRPGGVLRLSFPGLIGVLKRHYRPGEEQPGEVMRQEAYVKWWHKHFYCLEEIDLVAKHIGWSKVEKKPYGESAIPELHQRETRPIQSELNLIVELTK
jgi:predicted SAM-dependent methyltransferase